MGLSVDIKKKLGNFTLEVKFESSKGTLGLLGASGSGKSMTMKCIAGLDNPDEGYIALNDKVFFDSEKGINIPCRKRKVGYLFQNYALFPHLTVYQNIGFGIMDIPKNKYNSIIQEKIKMMKLEGLENRYANQLSGGQQQRVALARALAVDPEIILLDEPFSALDDYLRNHMVKQLHDTLMQYSGESIFVTHNMEEAYRLCNDLIVLSEGRQEAYGNKDAIFQKPPTIAAARLTGCKNVSAAEKVSDNCVKALDWGVELHTENLISENISNIGIRANYISLAEKEDNKNVFKAWISFIVEAPFRVTVYLNLGREPGYSGEYNLQWEISKEEWNMVKNGGSPLNICLRPNKLFVLVAK